jgi:hypothetical protein
MNRARQQLHRCLNRRQGDLGRGFDGDQDLLVEARRLGRPHPMEQRPAPHRVLIEHALLVQAGNWRWIR